MTHPKTTLLIIFATLALCLLQGSARADTRSCPCNSTPISELTRMADSAIKVAGKDCAPFLMEHDITEASSVAKDLECPYTAYCPQHCTGTALTDCHCITKKILDASAAKAGGDIPPEAMYAFVMQESSWRHYDYEKNEPLRGPPGHVRVPVRGGAYTTKTVYDHGLCQIDDVHKGEKVLAGKKKVPLDWTQILADPLYNCTEGARLAARAFATARAYAAKKKAKAQAKNQKFEWTQDDLIRSAYAVYNGGKPSRPFKTQFKGDLSFQKTLEEKSWQSWIKNCGTSQAEKK